jgi:hypothetical protein
MQSSDFIQGKAKGFSIYHELCRFLFKRQRLKKLEKSGSARLGWAVGPAGARPRGPSGTTRGSGLGRPVDRIGPLGSAVGPAGARPSRP